MPCLGLLLVVKDLKAHVNRRHLRPRSHLKLQGARLSSKELKTLTLKLKVLVLAVSRLFARLLPLEFASI